MSQTQFSARVIGAYRLVARLPRADRLPPWGWVVMLGLMITAFLGVAARLNRQYLVEAFEAKAGSMVPTIELGDHFFLDKRARQARRGDVVVFRYPRDPFVTYVKRVVALAGDVAEARKGMLWLNGKAVPARQMGDLVRQDTIEAGLRGRFKAWEEILDQRSYVVYKSADAAPQTWGPIRVPSDHLFVLGDNRDNSDDSNAWGPLPVANVVGHATFIWFSRGPEGIRWHRFNSRVQPQPAFEAKPPAPAAEPAVQAARERPKARGERAARSEPEAAAESSPAAAAAAPATAPAAPPGRWRAPASPTSSSTRSPSSASRT
jgi:signal peptidase I